MELNITDNEVQEVLEEIQIFLGGVDIEVDLTKYEVYIALKNAFLRFETETSIWQLKNQFINVYGMPAGLVNSNQLATVNFNLTRQITDWFASMARVGGKIPWHKDYVELEAGRQIYYLDRESSIPYVSGSRKIHRVMWYATPEILGGNKFAQMSGQADDVVRSNAFSFSNAGLNYGGSSLGFLGYAFDTMLMLQSIETRNNMLFSEFFHNLSGDVLEITPQPGLKVNVPEGARIYYYYFNEKEISAGTKLPEFQSVENETVLPTEAPSISFTPEEVKLVANPSQMILNFANWSELSPWAKTFCKELAFTRCKYIQASKWRKIQKTISSSENSYEIEFDYNSLLTEAENESQKLIENLRQDLESLSVHTLINNQKETVEAAKKINSSHARLWKIM